MQVFGKDLDFPAGRESLYTLARGIAKIGAYDLVLCGKQAIDGDTGQVGPGIAEQLGVPHVGLVRKIHEIHADHLVVERLTDDGYEVAQCRLPAVLTVVKEINEPRTPSLRGKMAAKKAEIIKWGAADLGTPDDKVGLLGSPTQVVKIMTPPCREGGEKYEGEAPELVDKLFDTLKCLEVV